MSDWSQAIQEQPYRDRGIVQGWLVLHWRYREGGRRRVFLAHGQKEGIDQVQRVTRTARLPNVLYQH